jgi:glycosyltransferase involved in cell wall biosynthesis
MSEKSSADMKALIISPQPFFSPRGTPLSVYYRTLLTTEFGIKIDLLTYGQGQNVDIPGVRIIRIPRFAFFGDVKVGPSLFKLILDTLIFLKTVQLLLTNRYEFVHAHEEAVFFCYLLKPFFRFKLVYDMHSSLPQQLTNFNFTKSKTLIRLFERLENRSLRSADAVITICEDLYTYAYNKTGDKNKLFIIENSIFDPILLPTNSDKYHYTFSQPGGNSKPFKIPEGNRAVVYTGTLEPYQGMNIVLESFRKVCSTTPGICLIVVGGSEKQVKCYSEIASNLGVGQHCIFTGTVTKALANHYINVADVLLSPRISGNNTPLKIYEQLASGKPLVATNIRSHTQVLTEDVAFLVEPEPDAMANGILKALRSDSTSKRKAVNAQKLYRERYSPRIYKEKMKGIFEFLHSCVE